MRGDIPLATNPQAVAKALLRAKAASQQPGAGGFGGVPAAVANGTSPLVASYDQWSYGRPGGPGLPRDVATFLGGSFGPLSPMTPTPVDQAEADGRAEPRRFEYRVGWNMPIGQPGDEGLKLASFGNLRTVADAYSVARACIQVRIQEILALGWEIGPTKEAEKRMRADHAARRDFDERRAAMKKFWRRPDPNYFGFGSWLSAALEDVLAVDALSIYLHPPRKAGRGVLGSNLAALPLLDGTSIRPLLNVQGGKPLPPNPAYQQYLYGVPRTDLMTLVNGEDVEDLGEAKVRDYRGDQLLYLPYVARDWTPYGFPPIERALVPILSGLQRQQYQLSYFDEGSVPGMFVTAGDPNATPNQMRELQDALNAMAGDPAWKHRIIVLPGGSKVDPIRPIPLADQFDEVIMTQVCMAFDIMPMELGISPKVSSTQSSGAANQMAKTSEAINQRKALKPMLKWLAEIFNAIIQDVIGQSDMEWQWEGLEKGEDETAKSARLVQEIGHGLRSIDEGRLAIGEQPWGLPITSDPVYFTASGVVPVTPPPAPVVTEVPGQQAGPAAGDSAEAKPAAPKPEVSSPAHSGAQAGAAVTRADTGAGTADAEHSPSASKIDTFAALRELDLLRRRIVKGRSIAEWSPEHLPQDVFEHLTAEAANNPEQALTWARTIVKARGRAVRRAHSVAVAEDLIVTGLRQLIEDLTAGTTSTAGFVDHATQVMRDGMRIALGVGAGHALADLGHAPDAFKAGKPPPKRLAGQHAPRIRQYAGQATVAYEEGYGLTTIASGSGSWVARWDVTSTDPCDLCEERNGKTFKIGQIPGYPGMGGFGKLATVCRGGPHCRCEITYIHTPDETPARPNPEPVTPGPVNATIEATLGAAQQQRFANSGAARRALAAAYPSVTDPDAENEGDPAIYEHFLDQLAEQRAEQQRPFLTGLMQDLLGSATLLAGTAAAAPAIVAGGAVAGTVITGAVAAAIAAQELSQTEAAPATVGNAPETAPRPNAVAKGKSARKTVHKYLARHYPEKVLGWVDEARWRGPVEVKLADIDMARRPGGARDPKKVRGIAQAVADGKKLDPVVLVRLPSGKPYQIADGFHRTLGVDHAGHTTIRAWIGEVDSETGPWDKAMHEAKLNKRHTNRGDAAQMHAYWTRGEGLARWANSPHPWQALYDHLLPHIVDPDETRRTVSQWFHDALGIWPGEREGKNPLGPG